MSDEELQRWAQYFADNPTESDRALTFTLLTEAFEVSKVEEQRAHRLRDAITKAVDDAQHIDNPPSMP